MLSKGFYVHHKSLKWLLFSVESNLLISAVLPILRFGQIQCEENTISSVSFSLLFSRACASFMHLPLALIGSFAVRIKSAVSLRNGIIMQFEMETQ